MFQDDLQKHLGTLERKKKVVYKFVGNDFQFFHSALLWVVKNSNRSKMHADQMRRGKSHQTSLAKLFQQSAEHLDNMMG